MKCQQNLVKSVPEDKEYEKARTLRALTNYVDLQPHSIETKTRIILEHFTARTAKTIEGNGRAMLVTPSRLYCVRYKQEFDRQMREMGARLRLSGGLQRHGARHRQRARLHRRRHERVTTACFDCGQFQEP